MRAAKCGVKRMTEETDLPKKGFDPAEFVKFSWPIECHVEGLKPLLIATLSNPESEEQFLESYPPDNDLGSYDFMRLLIGLLGRWRTEDGDDLQKAYEQGEPVTDQIGIDPERLDAIAQAYMDRGIAYLLPRKTKIGSDQDRNRVVSRKIVEGAGEPLGDETASQTLKRIFDAYLERNRQENEEKYKKIQSSPSMRRYLSILEEVDPRSAAYSVKLLNLKAMQSIYRRAGLGESLVAPDRFSIDRVSPALPKTLPPITDRGVQDQIQDLRNDLVGSLATLIDYAGRQADHAGKQVEQAQQASIDSAESAKSAKHSVWVAAAAVVVSVIIGGISLYMDFNGSRSADVRLKSIVTAVENGNGQSAKIADALVKLGEAIQIGQAASEAEKRQTEVLLEHLDSAIREIGEREADREQQIELLLGRIEAAIRENGELEADREQQTMLQWLQSLVRPVKE